MPCRASSAPRVLHGTPRGACHEPSGRLQGTHVLTSAERLSRRRQSGQHPPPLHSPSDPISCPTWPLVACLLTLPLCADPAPALQQVSTSLSTSPRRLPATTASSAWLRNGIHQGRAVGGDDKPSKIVARSPLPGAFTVPGRLLWAELRPPRGQAGGRVRGWGHACAWWVGWVWGWWERAGLGPRAAALASCCMSEVKDLFGRMCRAAVPAACGPMWRCLSAARTLPTGRAATHGARDVRRTRVRGPQALAMDGDGC